MINIWSVPVKICSIYSQSGPTCKGQETFTFVGGGPGGQKKRECTFWGRNTVTQVSITSTMIV